MANRIFIASIVALWLGSMTWLVVERILPSFVSGQPPVLENYQTNEVVAWSVHWSGERVGYAASVRMEGVAGTTELHNRILLDDVPLIDLAPLWMRHVAGDIGNISFDATTRMEFDSLENFSAFESRISLNEMPAVLNVSGRVDDSNLELNIRSNNISYPISIYMPDRRALNEALFPDARLPLLYEGRVWSEEVFSPLHAPNDPIEIVQVEAVSTEMMEIQGEIRRVMRVEYRGRVGPGVNKNAQLQAISWVKRNGTVLRHDVFIGGSELRFERLSKSEAAEIGVDLFERQIRQGGKINIPKQASPEKADSQLSEPGGDSRG